MKKWFSRMMVMVWAVALTGCAATKSTVTEFDKDGNITKKTETSESVVETVTKSTKEKTVVAWESGWAAYISVSTATQSDPTPTCKMFAGKTDKGLVSARPDQQNWSGIAEAINATKYELSVSAEGIGSTSSKSEEKTDAQNSAKVEQTAKASAKTE